MKTYKIYLILSETENVCVLAGLKHGQAESTCNLLNQKQPNCYFIK